MNPSLPTARLLSSVGLLLCLATTHGRAQTPAPSHKILFDPTAKTNAVQIQPMAGSEADVKTISDATGLGVTIQGHGKSGYPGFTLTPAAPWDTTGCGHVEIKVTNTGTQPIRIALSVANAGTWQENHADASVVTVKPGQTETLRTIFGYNYGQAGYPLNPAAILRADICTARTDAPQSYHLGILEAGGATGEKPPALVVAARPPVPKPAGGKLLGADTPPDVKQVGPRGGAKAVAGADGRSLQLTSKTSTATPSIRTVGISTPTALGTSASRRTTARTMSS